MEQGPNILFVCSGNIFRSPFAEQYFRKTCELACVQVKSFSRGTGEILYAKPHPLVVEVALMHGVDISSHKPQLIDLPDIISSTTILVMDDSHLTGLVRICPQLDIRKIKFLGSFANRNQIHDVKMTNITENFAQIKETYNVIAQAIDNIIDQEIGRSII